MLFFTIFQDVCQLPKVKGPCDDKVEMYWYDKSKDSCFTFDWGKFVHQPFKKLMYISLLKS